MLILKKKNIYYITYYGEMMMTFTNLKSLCLAITMLAILPLSDVFSQDLIMETAGATYNATANGVIKMKGAASSFVNNNANPLGTTSGDAIPGIVDWASTVGQDVQGLYYTNMVISGGANKNILDGVYITGLANLTPPSGYANFATYPFYIEATAQLLATNTFAGTFNYIGTTQSIFPVTGDNAYNNLAMDNATPGAYTMPDATVTTVNGTIALTALNTLAVEGDLFTGLASSIAGVVNVTEGGTINIATSTGAGLNDITFAGNITVTDGSIIADAATDAKVIIGSNSTLALAATTGILNFSAGTFLDITGAITNAGAGTNLLFDATSTVTYDGTADPQTILPTVNSNPYGNLILSSGEKVGGLEATYAALDKNNIAIAGDFSLAGGNLDMVTNYDAINEVGYVNMLDEDAAANYTDLAEVVGGFRRQFTTAAEGPYTFNNSGTELTFTGAPAAAGYYQLNIQGGVDPYTFVEDTDVDRKVVPTYAAALGDIEYTIKVAYLDDEKPTFTTNPDNLTLANMKFFEADEQPASEKLAGSGYVRVDPTATTFGTLSLSGILKGTGAVDNVIEKEFTSGHDLVLRANNTMYSIMAGRWSNPNTWDEGRTPVEDDNVEVRNFVYVGIDAGTGGFAATDGGTTDDNTLAAAVVNRRSESNLYFNAPGDWDAAARSIKIASAITGAALVIGNEDNDDGYVFKTSLAAAGSFLNANTTAHTGGLQIADVFTNKAGINSGNRNTVNGLWLVDLIGVDKLPIFSTYELKNEGAINNTGIIEVGE